MHLPRPIIPFNTTPTFFGTGTAHHPNTYVKPSTPAEESAYDSEFGFLGLLPPEAAPTTSPGLSLPTLAYNSSFYPNTTSILGVAADISTSTLTSTVFAPAASTFQSLAPISSSTGAAVGQGLGCVGLFEVVLGVCIVLLRLL